MILNIKKNYIDAKLPTRANPSDAGLDVYAHSYKIVGEQITEGIYRNIDFIEYDCGISIQPIANTENKDYFTYLAPRSSISKTNLLQCNSFGVIDKAYIGPLLIRYKYIPSPNDCVFFTMDQWPSFGIKIDLNKIYKVGDKIGQIIVTEQHKVKEIEVLELNATDRGEKGFGSSGQ